MLSWIFAGHFRVWIFISLYVSNFGFAACFFRICDRLQKLLDIYVRRDTKRHWGAADYLYTDKAAAGLGFINIESFVKGLKICMDEEIRERNHSCLD